MNWSNVVWKISVWMIQGGLVNHDHEKWLEKCEEVTVNRDGELVTMSSSQPTTPSKNIFKSLISFYFLSNYKKISSNFVFLINLSLATWNFFFPTIDWIANFVITWKLDMLISFIKEWWYQTLLIFIQVRWINESH